MLYFALIKNQCNGNVMTVLILKKSFHNTYLFCYHIYLNKYKNRIFTDILKYCIDIFIINKSFQSFPGNEFKYFFLANKF